MFLTEPKRQAVLIILVTLLAYGFAARPLDFATDVFIQGNLAYLALEQDGIRILNISDPTNPNQVAYFDTPGSAKSIVALDRYIFVADGSEGLLVLELTPDGNLQQVAKLDTPGNSQDLILRSPFLFLADGKAGIKTYTLSQLPDGINVQASIAFEIGEDITTLSLSNDLLFAGDEKNRAWIISIENPLSPRKLGEFDTKTPIHDLSLTENLLFLAGGKRGLIVLDVQDPTNPVELISLAEYGEIEAVTSRNELVYAASKLEGITVLDFSSPQSPAKLASIPTQGNPSGLFLTDRHLFVADGYDGLQVMDNLVILNPNLIGRTPAKVYPEDVYVNYPFAYIAAGESGLQVIDISNPTAPRQINQLDTPGYAYAVYQSGDLVYLANGTEGLSVVDVSDLNQPLPILETITFEDQVLDVIVQAGFAYLANGASGLRIIDLRDPRIPNLLGWLDTPGNANGLALYANYILLADGGAGLRIIDISNPLAPQETGVFETSGDAQAVALLLQQADLQPQATPDAGSSMPLPENTQEPQAVQTPAAQPFALVADGSGGLVVVDISRPNQPSQTARYESLDSIQDISVQGSLVAAAARDQGVSLLDLSNPAKPVQIALGNTPGDARAVTLQGTLVYTADFSRGLQILDISDLSQPSLIGFRDTPEKVVGLDAVGSIVFAVDGQAGLWVYDASNPASPVEMSFANTPGEPQRIAISGNRAYVADGSRGIQVFDLSNPLKPARIGEFDTPGEAHAVAVVEQLLYVADGLAGLQILDVTDPTNIQLVASLDTPGLAQGIAGTDRHIYIADGDQGLRIVNVSLPFAPVVDSIVREANQARQVQLQGSYAYVADGTNGLRIINIASPVRPQQVGQLSEIGNISDVYLAGGSYAFLSDLTGGIRVVDSSNPGQPVEVGFNALPGSPSEIAAVTVGSGSVYRIYAAYGAGGLNIFESTRAVKVSTLARFETPGTATLDQIRRGMLDLLSGGLGNVSSRVLRTIAQVIFDLAVMGFIGFLLWLRIIAQYVLPIHKWSERREVARRLVSYFYRQHGPAVAVREAKPILREDEEKRRGPGVMRVDLNSAVVLEKSNRQNTLSSSIRIPFWYRIFPHQMEPRHPAVRITGPGIVFTNANEIIRGAVDLRPQLRLRQGIKALTRDGIEVTNNVVTTFTLGQDADVLLVTFEKGVRHASYLRVVAVEEAVAPRYRKMSHARHKKMQRCAPRMARRGITAKRKAMRRLERTEPIGTFTGRKPMRRLLKRANTSFNPPKTARRRPVILHQSFLRIKNLTDELDEIDRREMFEYIQNEMSQTGMKSYVTVEPASRRGTPNKFSPERVFAALTSTAQALDRDDEVKDWTDLPPHIATQFYRDMLAEYEYDQLYEPKDPAKFPLKELKERFRLRMRNLGILSLRYIERVDGKALEKGQKLQPNQLQISAVHPLTSPKLLRTRGIKLISANFSEQKPDESVSKQRIDFWRARWERVANERIGESEKEAAAQQGEVWKLHSGQMVDSLKAIVFNQRYTDEVLTLRLFQALENLASDPETQKLLPGDTVKVIDAVRQWLLSDDKSGGGGVLPGPVPVPPDLPGNPSQGGSPEGES